MSEGGRVAIGGIALNQLECWDFVDPDLNDLSVSSNFSQGVPNGYGLGHGPYYHDVIECVRSRSTDVPVGATDGLESLKLIHAMYSSMEKGKWVSLSDNPESQRLGLLHNLSN